jgi:DNA ligase 1
MIRPTLAASIDDESQILQALRDFGSLYMSEKFDGIRGITSSGQVWSREAKPIRNRHLQKIFKGLPEGLDGEIVFRIDNEPIHPPLELINSVVTSYDMQWPRRWTPMFYAFDVQDVDLPYYKRYDWIFGLSTLEHLHIVKQTKVFTMREIIPEFNKVVNRGGEGIILRNPKAKYKQGRSTLRDGVLMRFKRVRHGRATITGFTNLEKHIGVQDRNAFGLAKRDAKKSNMQQQAEIGALLGKHVTYGDIKVGSGFTAKQRKEYFDVRNIGREFIFAYRDLTHKGVPRNPTFVEIL